MLYGHLPPRPPLPHFNPHTLSHSSSPLLSFFTSPPPSPTRLCPPPHTRHVLRLPLCPLAAVAGSVPVCAAPRLLHRPGRCPLPSAAPPSSSASPTFPYPCNPCNTTCGPEGRHNFSRYIQRQFNVSDQYNRTFYISPCSTPVQCEDGMVDCMVDGRGTHQLGVAPVWWAIDNATGAAVGTMQTDLGCGRIGYSTSLTMFCAHGTDTLTMDKADDKQCSFGFNLDSSAICNATKKPTTSPKASSLEH